MSEKAISMMHAEQIASAVKNIKAIAFMRIALREASKNRNIDNFFEQFSTYLGNMESVAQSAVIERIIQTLTELEDEYKKRNNIV